MNADTRGLKHKELTETIIGVFFEVYNELGHGFLESVYERAFEVALTAKGLDVRCQIEVPVGFEETVWAILRPMFLFSGPCFSSSRPQEHSIHRTRHNCLIIC